MARGRTHIVKHRRRRMGKTDYRLRLGVLKSGKLRIVVRKSSNNIICQVIAYDSKGDRVIASADSRGLKGYGWNGHCGNVPAAYLTGALCGVQAKKEDAKEAVPDLGLYTSVKGSRLYACLKGVSDAGIQVPHSEEIMPSNDRIEGKHTANSERSAKEFAAAKEKILSGKTAPKPAKKDAKETKTKTEKDGPNKAKKSVKPVHDKTKRPI
jgi:large subunit ribosomal protein L18